MGNAKTEKKKRQTANRREREQAASPAPYLLHHKAEIIRGRQRPGPTKPAADRLRLIRESLALGHAAYARVLTVPCPTHDRLPSQPCWLAPEAVCGARVSESLR